jgi:hypothetical protein
MSLELFIEVLETLRESKLWASLPFDEKKEMIQNFCENYPALVG